MEIQNNSNYDGLNREEKDFINFLNNTIPRGINSKVSVNKNKDSKAVTSDVLYKICELRGLNYNTDVTKTYKDIKNQKDIDKYYRVTYEKKAIDNLESIIKQYKNSIKGKKGDTVPMIVRQAIYFVIYRTLVMNFTSDKGEIIDYEKADFQKAMITAIGLNKKLFQSWRMYPVQDFINLTEKEVKLELYRNGKKRNDLLFMITSMVNKEYPKCFIDVFGGTGTVTAAKSEKGYEILNEYNPLTWNFLDCVKKYPEAILDECRKYHSELHRINDSEMLDKGEKRFIDVTNGLSTNYIRTDTDNISKFKDFYIKYQAFSYSKLELISSYEGNIKKESKKKRCEMAAAWYYIHSFKSNAPSNNNDIGCFTLDGYIKWIEKIGTTWKADVYKYVNSTRNEAGFLTYKYGTGIQDSQLPFDTEYSKYEIAKLSKRLSNVIIKNDDFMRILNEADSGIVRKKKKAANRNNQYRIKNAELSKPGKYWNSINDIKNKATVIAKDKAIVEKKIKPEKTVVYLDPPYFLTTQYEDAFCDEYHKQLLDWIGNTKCKWLLSCKNSITNEKQKDVVMKYRYGTVNTSQKEKIPLIKSFDDYYKGIKYGLIKNGNEYIADINKKINKKTQLYVYQLSNEKHNEVVITNFYSPVMTEESYNLFRYKKLKDKTLLDYTSEPVITREVF